MKARYTTGKITVEDESNDIKHLVRFIATAQEIFDADRQCGRCGQPNLRLRVRDVEAGSYYEMICLDCRSFLSFGQYKAGGLFVKRGEAPDHRGWQLPYKGSDDHSEGREAPPARADQANRRAVR